MAKLTVTMAAAGPFEKQTSTNTHTVMSNVRSGTLNLALAIVPNSTKKQDKNTSTVACELMLVTRCKKLVLPKTSYPPWPKFATVATLPPKNSSKTNSAVLRSLPS
ncbi:hypothetical protein SDC9_209810 [bioreactor metagenome]|uniref:Uncharacterized protein n=1 Tax=bioreactor metagenome TaxID=1076179 RepID=A0A645JP34_9ZZZZ